MRSVNVIGGGPAGSATAIRLAKNGWDVRLYEKASFPRHKLCGGFLSPEIVEELETMDVLERLYKEGAQPIRRVLISSPKGRIVETMLPGVGLSLARERLDMVLLERARACGAHIVERTDGFIDARPAEWTIVATGRNAAHPATPLKECYFGIQAVFDGIEGITDQVELDLIPGGYVGLARQVERYVNVCALVTQSHLRMTGPRLDAVLARWTEKNLLLRNRLEGARRVSAWSAIGPVSMGIRKLSEPGRLFVGDAACIVDPFMGEGISMGLRGSALIHKALGQTERSPEEAYAALWHTQFDRALQVGSWLRQLFNTHWMREFSIASLQTFPPVLAWLNQQTRSIPYSNA